MHALTSMHAGRSWWGGLVPIDPHGRTMGATLIFSLYKDRMTPFLGRRDHQTEYMTNYILWTTTRVLCTKQSRNETLNRCLTNTILWTSTWVHCTKQSRNETLNQCLTKNQTEYMTNTILWYFEQLPESSPLSKDENRPWTGVRQRIKHVCNLPHLKGNFFLSLFLNSLCKVPLTGSTWYVSRPSKM